MRSIRLLFEFHSAAHRAPIRISTTSLARAARKLHNAPGKVDVLNQNHTFTGASLGLSGTCHNHY